MCMLLSLLCTAACSSVSDATGSSLARRTRPRGAGLSPASRACFAAAVPCLLLPGPH
jgi:hypothetical protein